MVPPATKTTRAAGRSASDGARVGAVALSPDPCVPACPSLLLALAASLLLACSGGSKAGKVQPCHSRRRPRLRRGRRRRCRDPAVAAVKKGTLPNGLTYYIRKHDKPEKRAVLWLAVNAGSVLEDDDQRGLAHFVEHMAFNGTKRFPKQAIVDYLESIGMRFGADLNAYTTFDETVYMLDGPDRQPRAHRARASTSSRLGRRRDLRPGRSRQGARRRDRGVAARPRRRHARCSTSSRRCCSRARATPSACRSASRRSSRTAPRDTLVPLLQGLVPARPDGGDRRRRLRSGGDGEARSQARFGDLVSPASERARASAGRCPQRPSTRSRSRPIREAAGHERRDHRQPGRAPRRGDARRLPPVRRRAALPHDPQRAARRDRAATRRAVRRAPARRATHRVARSTLFSRSRRSRTGRPRRRCARCSPRSLRVEQHGFTQTELDARAHEHSCAATSSSATGGDDATDRDVADEITRNFFEDELMIGRKAELR